MERSILGGRFTERQKVTANAAAIVRAGAMALSVGDAKLQEFGLK